MTNLENFDVESGKIYEEITNQNGGNSNLGRYPI